MPDEDIPKGPLPPEDCPITTLIGKRVAEMTDEELETFAREMRTVVESPQELRKRMSFNKVGSGRKATKNTPKVDISKLLGL